MTKKILFFIFFTLGFLISVSSQTDVKKNYTKPYFQANVRVADTLGIDNLILFDGGSMLIGSSTNLTFDGIGTETHNILNFNLNATASIGLTTSGAGQTNLQTSGSGDVNINTTGSGNVTIQGISYPKLDGSLDFILRTDGGGNLSFLDVNSISNYSLDNVLIKGNQSLGSHVILDPLLPAGNGAFQSSPTLFIRGNYDSDPTAGVTSTNVDVTFSNIVQNAFGLRTDFIIDHFGRDAFKVVQFPNSGAMTTSFEGDDITSGNSYSISYNTNGSNTFNFNDGTNTTSVIMDFNGTAPKIQFVGDLGNAFNLISPNAGATRNVSFQDADGTIAFLSDIPTGSGDNIYNINGTLTGNRTVTMGTNSIEFLANNPLSKIVIGQTFSQSEISMYNTAGLVQNYFQSGATGMSYINEKLAIGQAIGVGATLDVLGDFRLTSSGTETDGNVLVTDATGLTSWTDILANDYQTNVVGGNTTTTLSAFDYAGGTTIMSGMTFTNLDAGTYLLSFSTSVSHSQAGANVFTGVSTGGVFVSGSERQFGNASSTVEGMLNYVQFPVVVSANDDISVHWIEASTGTATSLLGRNITIQKIN